MICSNNTEALHTFYGSMRMPVSSLLLAIAAWTNNFRRTSGKSNPFQVASLRVETSIPAARLASCGAPLPAGMAALRRLRLRTLLPTCRALLTVEKATEEEIRSCGRR